MNVSSSARHAYVFLRVQWTEALPRNRRVRLATAPHSHAPTLGAQRDTAVLRWPSCHPTWLTEWGWPALTLSTRPYRSCLGPPCSCRSRLRLLRCGAAMAPAPVWLPSTPWLPGSPQLPLGAARAANVNLSLWPLSSDDRLYLGLIAAYSVIVIFLWITPGVRLLLLPLKLVSIALHELSHATAALLTCGQVVSITVNADQGGCTLTRGGSRAIILSAGYLGSSAWGGALIFACRHPVGGQVGAGALLVALAAVAYWADGCLTLLGSIVMAGALVACWVVAGMTGRLELVGFGVLFVGVLIGLYSVCDIADDLVLRRVNESDAVQFAKECKCLPARGWGVLWGLLAVAVVVGSAVAAVAVFH